MNLRSLRGLPPNGRHTNGPKEGRKRRWSMEGEATGLGRAEGGSAGGGGVRHVPLQVACPYAEKEGVTVGS